jgi:ribulose-5-phosphate 4-epimerase/fuculose-1-phosphate aldolase
VCDRVNIDDGKKIGGLNLKKSEPSAVVYSFFNENDSVCVQLGGLIVKKYPTLNFVIFEVMYARCLSGERSEATAHLLQKVQSAQATQGDPI